MATVKPNTILKDQFIKKEAARDANRATITKALNTLLLSLPKVDPAVVEPAVDALIDAADQYKASQLLVDPEGRRSKPNIAKARASIAALHKHLVKAQEQLSNLPLNALTSICQVTGTPLGKMRSDLAQMRQAAEKALAEQSARPNKEADVSRNVLAYQVAVVFRDILKQEPATTSDRQLTENLSTARGGGAYARVLRATLEAAGVSNYDAGTLIAAGLKLLKDSNLPSTN